MTPSRRGPAASAALIVIGFLAVFVGWIQFATNPEPPRGWERALGSNGTQTTVLTLTVEAPPVEPPRPTSSQQSSRDQASQPQSPTNTLSPQTRQSKSEDQAPATPRPALATPQLMPSTVAPPPQTRPASTCSIYNFDPMMVPRPQIRTKGDWCNSNSSNNVTSGCEWHSESELDVVSLSPNTLLHQYATTLLTKAVLLPSSMPCGNESKPENRAIFTRVPECLGESKTLLVIGHSHTRYVAAMLCAMVNGSNCEQFHEQFRNLTVVPRGEGKPPFLVFLQYNYDHEAKLRRMKQELGAELRAVSHVIVSRGIWELHFKDGPLLPLAEGMAKLLGLLQTFFKDAKLIIHLPHYVHSRVTGLGRKPDAKKVHAVQRARWRFTCMATDRLQRLRVANMCARDLYESSAPGNKITAVYDTWRETVSSLGNHFADQLGHHYQDGFLEGLTQKLLVEHVCPPVGAMPPPSEPQPASMPEGAERGAHCKLVEAADANAAFVPDCGCHLANSSQVDACRLFARIIPPISRGA